MNTLNTIIEEEKREFDKQYGGQRFVYANELTMQDFLATAMQRAVKAERVNWLRSEIEKLEGEMRECPNHDPEEAVECYGYDEYYNSALTSIITRYKEELKVLENK